MKVCSVCNEEKENTEFYKNSARCKKCFKEYNKEYFKMHKAEVLKQQKRYRHTPVGREMQRLAIAKYQQTEQGKITLMKAQRKYRINKAWDADPEYKAEIIAFMLCDLPMI